MATVLGVLPIALALGDASTSRIPMGVAIIGGLIFSLFLTLYVIPAIYSFFKRNRKNSYERYKEEMESEEKELESV
jgi:multidrug efflux pump subunit AcrB